MSRKCLQVEENAIESNNSNRASSPLAFELGDSNVATLSQTSRGTPCSAFAMVLDRERNALHTRDYPRS